MSRAVYISTESPSSANQVAVNGKYFVLHIDNVSAIGEDHNLPRLDEYVSYSLDEMLDIMNKLSVSRDQIEKKYSEQWFDPVYGLELMKKYIDLVRGYHSLSNTSKSQILGDLEEYKTVLEILVKENIRWHFSYDK